MARDPETLAHLEWLGYVQPVGLVVSIPALLAAQAHINKNIIPDHQRFLSCLPHDKDDEPIPELRDFAEFTRTVLGWRDSDLDAIVPDDSRYAALEIPLPEYHETLRPTHVVREYEPKDPNHPWLMLIQVLPAGASLDEVATTDSRNWEATPHAKFERLLRESQVPIGLLVSNTHIRLVYAPRGETSGYATFSIPEMAQVAGRPIFAALHMLLCEERLFSLGEKQRLPAILADSRKYQNHVSNELAQQVLAALYELLRGFQAADESTKGELLREVLADNPNHVYGGLLTVLMRLVFVLYAEDRGLISNDPVYTNFYSVAGLFERLRADAGRYPDTMDQRYGGWAQFLTLFRLIYEGGNHGGLTIPRREGYLFDPDRYNFLEGRPWKTARRHSEGRATIPRVSDGVVFRVLNNLLILDGERLSYRTLDVEQIGSVYETMMGFDLEVAPGRSIAIKPKKSHGAPTTINLEALLKAKPAERAKWLKANADQDVTGQAATVLKEAVSVDDLLAALDKKIARSVTPSVVSKGTMVFQPSDERRRSGSHYTPRSLTEPIVRTALRPILKQLGPQPKPEQILALKVCDPAMGSGAFLVEACRQLGDELVKAWHVHDCVPKLPPDEDELLHARRLIAQRCLYGVDKNPFAVDLAKLSLWLATLAKDHPFTFLDHSLRCGDSLVGLTRDQIEGFHWQPAKQRGLEETIIRTRIERATEYRRKILAARDDVPYDHLRQCLDVADESLALVRLIGDAAISAFFSASKPKQRQERRDQLLESLSEWMASGLSPDKRGQIADAVVELHSGAYPIQPFHWQVEFPEVFNLDAKGKLSGGFDAIIGNPPFMAGGKISGNLSGAFRDWLQTAHFGSHGNADLVVHFFRSSFDDIRSGGTFGLIATNTIGQGDTRSTGLTWICQHGGVIYSANRRFKWPGTAAVIISVVHVYKGHFHKERTLDGKRVDQITAYLFHTGGHENPYSLRTNDGLSFNGAKIYGQGFCFDDVDPAATPLAQMEELLRLNPGNSKCIYPYIGGQELNDSPTHSNRRFVINFEEWPLRRSHATESWIAADETERASFLRKGIVPDDYPGQVAADYPQLLDIVERRVKPERLALRDTSDGRRLKRRWWTFGRSRPELQQRLKGMERVIVLSEVGPHLSLAFLPSAWVFAHTTKILAFDSYGAFAALQCRCHEVWARFFSSSMKDDLRYTPSDCFETFPFAADFQTNSALEATGKDYYELRAEMMVTNNEGLTKTYNRFHDPDEHSADMLKLRDLHAAMDRAVLEAYGWHDLAQTATCEFLLDYEDDEEDEAETGGKKSKKKKPWRHRWPDDFRDEVLARLLALNAERAEQERLAGIAAEEVQAAVRKQESAEKPASKKPRRAVKAKAGAAGRLFEREREQFYIWLLLRAWDKPLTRHALDGGLVLMLNDALRTALLDASKRRRKSTTTRPVEGLDYILQEMETLGYIEIDNSGPQQILTILSKAPSTDSAPAEDRTRIEEVKKYFDRERARGNVTETQEHIDAKPDLVSTR